MVTRPMVSRNIRQLAKLLLWVWETAQETRPAKIDVKLGNLLAEKILWMAKLTYCIRIRRRSFVLARTFCTTWPRRVQALVKQLIRRPPVVLDRSSSQHNFGLRHELPIQHPKG